jgi:hypothetical protein
MKAVSTEILGARALESIAKNHQHRQQHIELTCLLVQLVLHLDFVQNVQKSGKAKARSNRMTSFASAACSLKAN